MPASTTQLLNSRRGRSRLRHKVTPSIDTRRVTLINWVFIAFFAAIIARLSYWQIVRGKELAAQAENQYQRTVNLSGQRGRVLFADGSPLVTNQVVYRVFAQPDKIPAELLPLLPELATQLANLASSSGVSAPDLLAKLVQTDRSWISLVPGVDEQTQQLIRALEQPFIGFDRFEKRAYPEASLAAHLLGFVGKTADGKDIGYFGIEGALEQELKPRNLRQTVKSDAKGGILSQQLEQRSLDGREITTTLHRGIQRLLETELANGIARYGAEAGEAIVLDPQTGDILGLAAFPNYDPTNYANFPPDYYINPSIGNLYEPGSTMKVLTVAAGIDAGVIRPDTICTNCSGPRVFGKYTLKTWNEEYHPNITMTDALAKSDNVAMIFVAEKLGQDKFVEYLQKFGLGTALQIELQGDRDTPLPKHWGAVELATSSFGQGISLNSLQLLRAVTAIANQGQMVRPRIVKSVTDVQTQETIAAPVDVVGQSISRATAETVTQMMVTAATAGEAQWTASKTHIVAGKTGTSQIPIAGGYREDATVASYIGFSPASNPKFLMLIKLVAPQSSPWAAETAAPLWYRISEKLYLMLNIPPDKITPT